MSAGLGGWRVDNNRKVTHKLFHTGILPVFVDGLNEKISGTTKVGRVLLQSIAEHNPIPKVKFLQ